RPSHSSREGHMDVFHAIVARLSVDLHHVVEAAGIVVLGLVLYSYSRRWFESVGRVHHRLRSLMNGLIFGVLTIALMISRIEVGQGIYVDARAVPIALVTLVEGSWAGLIAAVVAAGYRAWRGGGGGLRRVVADVAQAEAAEAARRHAAALRAVTRLARAAAHEINNALMVVAGGLAILARRLPADREDAQWAARARDGVNNVKDIVTRMNAITQIEEVPGRGLLAPMLDIRRSSRSSYFP